MRLSKSMSAIAALGLAGAGCVPAAQPVAAAPAATPAVDLLAEMAADYTNDANWLCLPGRGDVCQAPLDIATVQPDGAVTTRDVPVAANPEFDCFYVYGTISLDKAGNADLNAGPEERGVVEAQFAPFRSVCRTFVPIYRQLSLTALRARVEGGTNYEVDEEVRYADVRAAWRDYIANRSDGRGVVLIGHSQGAHMLSRLVAEEIEHSPAISQVIAAYLIGWNVMVPRGRRVGGSFQKMPLCSSANEAGCIVTYSSYMADDEPLKTSPFGYAESVDMEVGCTNPGALGSEGATGLQTYLNNKPSNIAPENLEGNWASGTSVTARYVDLPGLVEGTCRRDGAKGWLSIAVNADEGDPRIDDIGGASVPGWGLHILDVNLAMGDLLTLAKRQARAWKE